MQNNKTILLIGAEGFLGKNLGDLLHSFGYDIIGIDIQTTKSTKYIHYIQKNIFDLCVEDMSFLNSVDSYGLIYTGGVSRNGVACTHPIESSHNTVTALIKLLELLNDSIVPKWMMMTSTREVDILLNDKTLLNKKQKLYSVLKFSAELIIESYQEEWNIPLKVFRLSDIFGLGDHPSKVMQIFFNKAINNEDISVHNSESKLFLTEVNEISSIIYEHVKTLNSVKHIPSTSVIKLWDDDYFITLLELAYLAIEFNPTSKSKILAQEVHCTRSPIKKKLKLSHIKVLNNLNNSLIE